MTGNSLPKGWRLVKFGDLVRKVSSRVDPESSGISRYVAGEHMDSDNLNITRWGIVGDGYLGPAFTMRFQPGQVLYGSRRTYLRKVALADFEGICANTTFVLETKSADLLQEFLPHVMSTERFHAHSISKSKGSVNPYINFVDLNDYEFALPPIAEQHRIIRAMKALEYTRDSYSEIETATLRTAVVLESHPSNLILRERVDSLCENVRDSSLGRDLDKHQCVVGLEHMISGEVFQKQFGDNTAVSGAVTKFARGDVLYGKLRPNLRKVSIATFDGYCTTEILALRPRETYYTEVLHAVLSSKYVLNEVLKYSKGTKMPRVNPGDLMSLEVPTLNAEQLRNASLQLNALNLLEEKRVASYRQSADLMRAIRESLLNGAVREVTL